MLVSCAAYHQNIMFKVPQNYALAKAVDTAEKNYTIQVNDLLSLDVYTMNGERVIDPDLELTKDLAGQSQQLKPQHQYLVDTDGTSDLPMVGKVHLAGLTLQEADEVLSKNYSNFYKEPYVLLHYLNKRVIVLGEPGGQVIPLTNENMRLVEVIALAKGISNDARATDIRVIRGDQVWVVDFSTIDGYKAGNMVMQPGDIVYIEPIRKPISEGLRDYGPLVSVITTLTTLLVVIFGIK